MISEILLFLNNNPTYWLGFFGNLIWLGLILMVIGFVIGGFTIRYSLAALIIGALLLCGSFYISIELQNSRPFSIEPGYSFNTSTNLSIASLGDNSLENGINGHGTFLLGTGHASIKGGESIPVYVFYKKLAPDEYTQDYIPSKGVIIKTDEEINPNIEWIYLHEISEKKTYNDTGEIVGGRETVSLVKTFIHVPKNTVKKEYDLDSKV